MFSTRLQILLNQFHMNEIVFLLLICFCAFIYKRNVIDHNNNCTSLENQ